MEDIAMKAKVQTLIDTKINPALAGHGGSVDLIGVKDGKVSLRMAGGCHGCASSQVTVKAGIEAMLKEEIPEVVEVVDVTDHATGRNPFYAAGW